MSIKVESVSKFYGNQRALDRVSFKLDRGEVVGFLGPNGAGKSTMMKILTCYIPPNQGKAEVRGFDVLENSMEVRKRVGYLPEHNPLYLDMYVKEFLHFIGGIYGIKNRDARVAEMIDLVGISKEQHKKVGELSKGYRQRVGLAQTLIHDPEVLILDEPTSGLDPLQLAEIRELIKEIGKTKTVLLSTHIMQEVEAVCDRVIIINEGQIVADDTVEKLISGLERKTIFKVSFSDEVSVEELSAVEGIDEVNHVKGNRYEIVTAAGPKVQPKILDFAAGKGVEVTQMTTDTQNLESVFRELTSKRLDS